MLSLELPSWYLEDLDLGQREPIIGFLSEPAQNRRQDSDLPSARRWESGNLALSSLHVWVVLLCDERRLGILSYE